MKRPFSSSLSWALGWLITLLLAGCQGDRTVPKAASAEAPKKPQAMLKNAPPQLSIGIIPTQGVLPLYYLRHTLQEAGITLQSYDSQADCDTALLRGHIDGATTDLVRLIYYTATRGTHWRAVMTTQDDWVLLINKHLRTKQLAAIRGKLVAIQRFSASSYVLSEALKKEKLPEDAVYRPQINDLGTLLQMLQNYQIEAAILPRPQADVALQTGHQVAFQSAQNKEMPGCLVFSKKALSNTHKRRLISHLIHTYNKVRQEMSTLSRSTLDSLYTHEYHFTLAQSSTLKPPSYTTAQAVRPHDAMQAYTWLAGQGVPVKHISINDLLNTTFIKE